MNNPTLYRPPHYDRPNVVSRFWSPQQVGETLSGWFAGLATEVGQYGPAEMLGVYDPLGRERTVRLTIELDDQLRALRPVIGQGITIVYRGADIGGKRGRSFGLSLSPGHDNRARMTMTASEAASMGPPAPAPATDERGEPLPF